MILPPIVAIRLDNTGTALQTPIALTFPAVTTVYQAITVKGQNGAVFDLTGCAVILTIRDKPNGTLIINRQAIIDNASAGTAHFVLIPTDTIGLGGSYVCSVDIIYPSGDPDLIVPISPVFITGSLYLPTDPISVLPQQTPLGQGPPGLGQFQSPAGFALPQRSAVSVDGALLIATDNPGANRTDLTLAVGTTSGTLARGSDSRFSPAPGTLGNIVVDNGATYISQPQQTFDARNYSSFAAAVTAIGSIPATLTISTTLTVSTAVTVPSTLALEFRGQGQLNITTGSIVVFGSLTAPLTQIFSGANMASVAVALDCAPYLYPQWWGAKSDTSYTYDSTVAFQAAATVSAASRNKTVFVPNGLYRISGQIQCKQGTKWIGAGGQGSNFNYCTSIKHFSNGNLFVWDGTGSGAAGTGGGLEHWLLIKALGFSGGDAIYLLSSGDNNRPGEMEFKDVLIYGEGNSTYWGRGLHLDGTASNTPSGRGVRSVHLSKFRVSGTDTTNFPNQAIWLNQPTHFFAEHLQMDPTGGPIGGFGNFGMTIEGNWDQVYLASCEINGNLIVSQPPDGTYFPTLFVRGGVSLGLTCNATTAVGDVTIAGPINVNSSNALGTRSAGSSSTYNEFQSVTGTWTLNRLVTNAVDTSATLQVIGSASAGSPTLRSPGLRLAGAAWNPVALQSQAAEYALQVLPLTNNPIGSDLLILSRENGGTWTTRASLTNAGVFQATGDIYAGGSGGAGSVFAGIFNPNSSIVMNFGTSSNATGISIGNNSVPIIFAGGNFDLTRLTGSVLGQPTWASTQTLPGLVVNGSYVQNVGVTNSVNTAFQLNSLNAATSGSPVQRSPGSMWSANIWDTGALASQTAQWVAQATGTSQSGVAGTWLLASQLNGGGWNTQLSVQTNGQVNVTGNLFVGGTAGLGTVNALVFNPNSTGVMNFGTSSNATGVSIGNNSVPLVFAGGNFDLTRLTGSVLGTPTWGSTQTFPGVTNTGGQQVHRTTVNDLNYPSAAADYLIAYTTLTVSRTITLTVGGTASAPKVWVIKDESGSASGSVTLTVQGASGTIDGAATKVVVNTAYGFAKIYCNGTNFFTGA